MASLTDYLKHFENVAKYTSFTDSDEFLFSLKGLDIEEYLLQNKKKE